MNHSAEPDQRQTLNRRHIRQILAGACAIAISIGLIRADFGVVAGLMVEDGWLKAHDIGVLAGLNMVGYLLGSFHQSQIREQLELKRCLLIAVIAGILSLGLASFKSGLIGEAVLRVTAGWSAGHLLSGSPSLALSGIPVQLQRRASAAILGGGGIGTVLGASAISLFQPPTATAGWGTLAVLNLILAGPVIWLIRTQRLQEFEAKKDTAGSTPIAGTTAERHKILLITLLGFGIFLAGAGRVPMFVYGPLVAETLLNITGSFGTLSIGLAGVGALTASFCLVCLPRSVTTHLLLPLAAAIGLLGSFLYVMSASLSLLLLSGFLLGAWGIAISSLTLAQLQIIAPVTAQRRLWSLFTTLQAMAFLLFSMFTAPFADQRLPLLLEIGVMVLIIQFATELAYAAGVRYQNMTRKEELQT